MSRGHEQYHPLLDDDEEFISYDDGELEQKYHRGRKIRRNKRVCCLLILLIAVVTIVTLLIIFFLRNRNKSDFPNSDSKLGKFKKAAIASDSQLCTDIGVDILHRGSTVDATIAVLLCYGVVNPVSSGIGGGFFMTVYDSKKGNASVINARETAPINSTETMYEKVHNSSKYGGLSIAVPGEIKGYMEAWKRWGKLPWRELFNRSIELAKNGFHVFLCSLYSPKPPSSGAILSFIFKILDGFNMTENSLKAREARLTAYHRIIEAFKFAYAQRSELGDPEFVSNVTQVTKILTSADFADKIRKMIWDNATHSTPYYGPVFNHKLKTSTAHLSLLGNDGIAVAVTSTVNLLFGSGVTGKRTGILFNDEMDDFSSPNITNAFGIPPSPANFIKPGKRPMSSMCPAVLADKTKRVRLVVGAAGGSRITSATAYIAAHVLWFGYNIKEAIDARRLHHQLIPQQAYYEPDFPQYFIDGLRDKGHNMTFNELGESIANGIVQDKNWIYANNDFRRPGGSSGGW